MQEQRSPNTGDLIVGPRYGSERSAVKVDNLVGWTGDEEIVAFLRGLGPA
jgi:hypothetical protein